MTKDAYVAEEVSKKRKKLSFAQVKNINDLPMFLTEEPVSLLIIKDYFEPEIDFDQLGKRLKRRANMRWTCGACFTDLIGDLDIACDACLVWYCRGCTKLKDPPKGTNWFCSSCKTPMPNEDK